MTLITETTQLMDSDGSESSLSTAGGAGLEELAAFVRRSSTGSQRNGDGGAVSAETAASIETVAPTSSLSGSRHLGAPMSSEHGIGEGGQQHGEIASNDHMSGLVLNDGGLAGEGIALSARQGSTPIKARSPPAEEGVTEKLPEDQNFRLAVFPTTKFASAQVLAARLSQGSHEESYGTDKSATKPDGGTTSTHRPDRLSPSPSSGSRFLEGQPGNIAHSTLRPSSPAIDLTSTPPPDCGNTADAEAVSSLAELVVHSGTEEVMTGILGISGNTAADTTEKEDAAVGRKAPSLSGPIVHSGTKVAMTGMPDSYSNTATGETESINAAVAKAVSSLAERLVRSGTKAVISEMSGSGRNTVADTTEKRDAATVGAATHLAGLLVHSGTKSAMSGILGIDSNTTAGVAESEGAAAVAAIPSGAATFVHSGTKAVTYEILGSKSSTTADPTESKNAALVTAATCLAEPLVHSGTKSAVSGILGKRRSSAVHEVENDNGAVAKATASLAGLLVRSGTKSVMSEILRSDSNTEAYHTENESARVAEVSPSLSALRVSSGTKGLESGILENNNNASANSVGTFFAAESKDALAIPKCQSISHVGDRPEHDLISSTLTSGDSRRHAGRKPIGATIRAVETLAAASTTATAAPPSSVGEEPVCGVPSKHGSEGTQDSEADRYSSDAFEASSSGNGTVRGGVGSNEPSRAYGASAVEIDQKPISSDQGSSPEKHDRTGAEGADEDWVAHDEMIETGGAAPTDRQREGPLGVGRQSPSSQKSTARGGLMEYGETSSMSSDRRSSGGFEGRVSSIGESPRPERPASVERGYTPAESGLPNGSEPPRSEATVFSPGMKSPRNFSSGTAMVGNRNGGRGDFAVPGVALTAKEVTAEILRASIDAHVPSLVIPSTSGETSSPGVNAPQPRSDMSTAKSQRGEADKAAGAARSGQASTQSATRVSSGGTRRGESNLPHHIQPPAQKRPSPERGRSTEGATFGQGSNRPTKKGGVTGETANKRATPRGAAASGGFRDRLGDPKALRSGATTRRGVKPPSEPVNKGRGIGRTEKESSRNSNDVDAVPAEPITARPLSGGNHAQTGTSHEGPLRGARTRTKQTSRGATDSPLADHEQKTVQTPLDEGRHRNGGSHRDAPGLTTANTSTISASRAHCRRQDAPSKTNTPGAVVERPTVVALGAGCGGVSAWFENEVVRPAAAAVADSSETSPSRVTQDDLPEKQLDRGGALFNGGIKSTDRWCGGNTDGVGCDSPCDFSTAAGTGIAVGAPRLGADWKGRHGAGLDTGQRTWFSSDRSPHPARLFHFLWQRNRLRCPFSRCPIPATVVFDSMGEATDWFFTSGREGCVKRKLTSNTRLSNIFREFCKGGESGADPVATLISWLPDGRCENDAISTATYPGEGSRRARGESPPRGGAHSRPDDEPSHGQSSRHQHLAPAVGHLTARDLHAFLFGESCTPWENPSAAGGKRPRPFDCADTAAAVAAAVAVPPRKSAKRNRNGRGGAETLGGGVSLTDAAGAVAVAEFRKERSEAAAAAAVAGGGFCLLQAYLPPTGARNSTLRCHWAPARPVDPASRSMTDGDDVSGPSLGKDWGCRQELGVSRRAVLAEPARKRVMGGLGGGGGGGRSSSCCRWGDAEGKMETGCRERSPDRSALREQERSPESPLIPERSGRRVVERGGENVSRPTLSFSPEDTAIVRSQDSFQRGSLAAENTAGGPWKGKINAGSYPGTAELAALSGSVLSGCLFERCTNVFRAGRQDLSCEDRCVTFEAASPSGSGVPRPRSVQEPLKSLALRETLVEDCTAVADHVFQVTRGNFRAKGFTGYFRQGVDGQTRLMFVSRWGVTPSTGVDRHEPLLLRAQARVTHKTQRERYAATPVARMESLIRAPSSPTAPRHGHPPGRQDSLEGVSRNCQRILSTNDENKNGEKRAHDTCGQRPNLCAAASREKSHPAALVYGAPPQLAGRCPGCGGPFLTDAAVSVDSDLERTGDERTDGDKRRKDLLSSPDKRNAYAARDSRAGIGDGIVAKNSAPSASNLADSPTGTTVVTRAHHTTLGVIVDACTWQRRRASERVPERALSTVSAAATSNTGIGGRETSASLGTDGGRTSAAPATAATAGIARCSRALAAIYPGLSADLVSDRCAVDPRLRLRELKVCRECAIEIANASDERLRETHRTAREKAERLAKRLGIVPPPSLSKSQRRARLLADSAAFKQRMMAGPEIHTSRPRGFGGGPSLLTNTEGRATVAPSHGQFPRRPVGSNDRKASSRKWKPRPGTVDGSEPRKQGFAHPSRKVVSATTPVGGFSAVHEISKPGGSGAAVIRRGDGWTSPPATRSARFSVGGSRTGSGTESGSWSRIGSRNGSRNGSRKDSCDDARGDRVRKGISKGGNESSWFDGGDGMGASSVGEWTSVAIDCENVDCEDERSSLGSPRYRHGDGDLRVEHVSPREPHGDASASRCYTETGQMGGMGVFEGSGFAFAGESVDHCRRTGPDPAAALTTQGQIDAATEALSVTREMTPHSPRKQHSDDERLRLGHPARSPVFNFYAPSEVARRNHRVYRTYGGCHRLPPRVDMPLTSAGKSQRTKSAGKTHAPPQPRDHGSRSAPRRPGTQRDGRQGVHRPEAYATSPRNSNALQWAKIVTTKPPSPSRRRSTHTSEEEAIGGVRQRTAPDSEGSRPEGCIVNDQRPDALEEPLRECHGNSTIVAGNLTGREDGNGSDESDDYSDASFALDKARPEQEDMMLDRAKRVLTNGASIWRPIGTVEAIPSLLVETGHDISAR